MRDIVQPIAEEKSLTVRLTPPEADFRIGHPVALSRVLLNLTTNALKFTAEGFVEVIARQTRPRRVEFSVRDTGRGIPPQSMATLFEPFRRRQKPGEYAFSGSGLGPVHLPQAGRGDGLDPRGRDRSRRWAPGSTSSWTCPWRASPSSAEPLPPPCTRPR